MKQVILPTDFYFENFTFRQKDQGCGFETEGPSGENYFYVQTHFPKSFFDFTPGPFGIAPMVKYKLEMLPDDILIKLELFGRGNMGIIDTYVFKPWATEIDDPNVFQYVENFHLHIPAVLFHHLTGHLLFNGIININQVKFARVLEDVPVEYFQGFGLDRANIPTSFKTNNLNISRMKNPDVDLISDFYTTNWFPIDMNLKSKYFRPILNIWYKVSHITDNSIIGFIRLYNRDSTFTGGMSIEIIVQSDKRNNKYASEFTEAMVEFIKHNSFALMLEADANKDNVPAVRVLEKTGFTVDNSQNHLMNANYELVLIDYHQKLESELKSQNIVPTIELKYAKKYDRYF